jgi:hypothetical protein
MTPAMDSRGVKGGRFDGPQDSWTRMKHKSCRIGKGSLAWNECKIGDHGGEMYPHLIRDDSKPDVLSKIIERLVKKK